MPTTPDQHGMVRCRLIEFRRGGQESLCRVDLMPGSRGLDPGAWRSLGSALSDQVDEFGKSMCPVNRNQAHILRREHEMVMGIFESRQDGQIRGIQDLGIGADQPVQAMGVLRDRHDPSIADGGGLVDRAMLGHGVNGTCTDQQVRQVRSMERRGRKPVLVHHPLPLCRVSSSRVSSFMRLYSGVNPPGHLHSKRFLQSEKAASPLRHPRIPRHRSYRSGPGPHE